ncbi:uncharacterized protein LOC143223500 isoform X2 [Tachypleus tridentatus]
MVKELGLTKPKVRMSNTGAPVNEAAKALHLDEEEIVLEDGFIQKDIRAASDDTFSLVEDLLLSEQDYNKTLKSVCDVYAKPLRKLLCLGPDEHKALFDWVDPLCSLSNLVINKLQVALRDWDPCRSRIGNIFSKQLWTKYAEYQDHLTFVAVPLLKDKEANDNEFTTLCQQRQGATKYSLQDLLFLPLERLAQYESILSQVAAQTSEEHPDFSDRWRATSKAMNMVRRGESAMEETDLDRVQDLFPHDNLNLYEQDPFFSRKTLFRAKSVTANKIQRAFSTKGPKVVSTDSKVSSPRTSTISTSPRSFIMEGSVQFLMGVQRQERHLFLFSDILIVGKPRSSGTYKQKERLSISELWLSSCLSEVCEFSSSPEVSFVLGWPTTNVVVSFSSPQIMQLWQSKLMQLIPEAKKKEDRSVTTLQVCYWDHEVNEEFFKTVKVRNTHSTNDCIRLILDDIGQQSLGTEDFQLWVKTGKDETPYPLIGHEFPFYIKMNFVRRLLQHTNFDLQKFSVTSETKCIFILRQSPTDEASALTDATNHKKRTRRPTLIGWPFKRHFNKQENNNGDVTSSPISSTFVKSFSKLWSDESLPRPVLAILNQLFQRGPFTVGIFRKSANTRMCRELKEKLEANPNFDFKDVPVSVLAALFKEFLRSLPDCVLGSSAYKDWLETANITDEWEKRKEIIRLLGRISPANTKLLQHFVCVLWHISQHSAINKMSAENLAVCVGSSMLFPSVSRRKQLALQPEVSKQVPKIVAYLISKFPELFGKECVQLFGVLDKDVLRNDSGAEESDSLHSQQEFEGCRQDNSSIDSLERELLEGKKVIAKLPNKVHISLTNLSRDSGLTLSDTQLYTPEGGDENTDSRGSTHNSKQTVKSAPNLDLVGLEAVIHSSKDTGASIDGSCYKVMRKRKQEQENYRSRGSGSANSSPLRSHFRANNIQTRSDYYHVHPLQYSPPCSYGIENTLLYCLLHPALDASPTEAKRRVQSIGSVLSSTKMNDMRCAHSLRRTASEDSLAHSHSHELGALTSSAHDVINQGIYSVHKNEQEKEHELAFKQNEDKYFCSNRIVLPEVCVTEETKDEDQNESTYDTLLCPKSSSPQVLQKSNYSRNIKYSASEYQSKNVDSSTENLEEMNLLSVSELNAILRDHFNVKSICGTESSTSPIPSEAKENLVISKSSNSNRSSGSGDSFISQPSMMSDRASQLHSSDDVSVRSLKRFSSYHEASDEDTSAASVFNQEKFIDRSTQGYEPHYVIEDSLQFYDEEVQSFSLPVNKLFTPPPTPPKPLKKVFCDTNSTQSSQPSHEAVNSKVTDSYGASFVKRPLEDWRNEISWSVAKLREYFDSGTSNNVKDMPQCRKHSQESFVTPVPRSSTRTNEDCVTLVRVGCHGRSDSVITVRKRIDSDFNNISNTKCKESYV